MSQTLGLLDLAVFAGLTNRFGSLLENGSDDIYKAPEDIGKRVREKDVDAQLTPWITFWRGAPSFDDSRFNYGTGVKGVKLCIPPVDGTETQGTEVKIKPITLEYTINFWGEDLKDEMNLFDERWVGWDKEEDFNLPIYIDMGAQDPDFNVAQDFVTDSLIDNSGVERQFSEGVELRHTGELTLNAFTWSFSGAATGGSDDDLQIIREVVLNTYENEIADETKLREILV